MYLLIIFWWCSFAGQQTHVEFKSLKACESAQREIEVRNKDSSIGGTVYAFCTKK
jgi:hypothetical protein